MRLVKIGVAGVSVKVGDFAGNAARLRGVLEQARGEDTHLLVTPELAISGYSLGDRVWWPDIARRSWDTLERLAEHTEGIAAWLGLPIHMRGQMYNGVAMVYDGEILGLILKQYLPTYSIFYEGRTWTSWTGWFDEHKGVPVGDLVFDLPFGKVSAEICEDLWSAESPAFSRAIAGAEIICNCSASPFTPLKNGHRVNLVHVAASRMMSVYAFANLLGLDDSRLVFDGGGIIAKPERVVAVGEILSKKPWTLTTAAVDLDQITRIRAENSTWKQGLGDEDDEDNVVTVQFEGDFTPAPVAEYAATLPESFFWPDNPAPEKSRPDQFLDELFDAMVLGLRDYFEKVGAFKKFLIALSGGRDSALCLLTAVEAAKAFNDGENANGYGDCIETIYLPNSAFSSRETRNAAESLASELAVPFKVVTIEEEAEIALKKAAEIVGGADKVADMARQNLQARIRGAMMLNWANSVGGLLLVTSNLSEAAVGYTTTGGDNQGGFSPIANVPKTLVSRLLAYVAKRDGIKSLQGVLDIPPSAELASDQQDEKDLMPYAVLDDLLYLFAGRRMALANCWRILVHRHPEHDEEALREWTMQFGKLFAFSQWKREQLPVALKVLELDLDPKTGFRFPVTQSIDDELNELKAATL